MNQFLKIAIALLLVVLASATGRRLAGDNTDHIKVIPDFRVEHLFSPSKAGMGSWVAMTFDPGGRLITSDQYGALYRLETVPGQSLPKIEKLQLENDSLNMGAAQGLLWAFDALYLMVNNRPSEKLRQKSGLYKLEDTDQNDQFDKITLLKELQGEGEHGPHSIILSPDSLSLYVISGNHTDAPEMDSYRLPKTWQHDNLYPFIKDPRGHATDRREPGGWIARVDPLTNHWEFVSGGYRNAFDIAFNESGDLFTYDSDMEWEFGLPWYRPTRICHVTSGSEFGWRTASGKWPETYADNLPPVINIGQGSPTNLISLKNAAFPPAFENTLLAFDWSFGIIHAVHLKPDGAGYSAERTEFLSGVPLPLTDGVIGPDGALYFLTGGRRLQSDLYRVSYTGQNRKGDPAASLNEPHLLRRRLEAFHEGTHPEALQEAWPFLDHQDRLIRYAARIAVEHQPTAAWASRALEESNPSKAIYALMALIRTDPAPRKTAIGESLLQIGFDTLSEEKKVDLFRTAELLFARTGPPDPALKARFIKALTPYFPSKTENVNRQLAKLLVYLEAPGIARQLVQFLEAPENNAQTASATSSEDLIFRNPAYGIDIARMLEKLPPARQTYYAILLSSLKTGWTPALQEKYLGWYRKAFSYRGGLSYIGFLDRARKTALSRVPPQRYAYFDKISGGDLLAENGNDLTHVTFPKGPGRSWKTEEAAALFNTPLTGRNFEQGRNMYLATLCNRCHTLQGEGANAGPDLTRLGSRFSTRDILEAIIEPNNFISDQYASTQLQLRNGDTRVGRIVTEDQQGITLSQNPFTPDITMKIAKKDIVSRHYSSVSIMLPGLINSLNEEELKDLMAYLIAGGDKGHTVFNK